ncbi:hypothetical protein TIFTF001_045767 [Ficus carica]|uniref:Uncharacterized protein n=1 Tax=Ficus carica TaxID=3494 RepID=A0AA87YW52_FICCA|nr:hypothetical protein TIFTF001_045767 [Ficus carica]
MDQLPEDLPRLEILEELFLDGTAMRTFPSSILLLKNLKLLSLRRYGVVPHKLWKSLLSFCSLPLEFSEFLDLKLPDDISCLSSLQQLDLSESNLRSIPESISQLSELIDLRLSKCRNLRSLPKHLPSSLKILETCDCPMLTTDGLDSMIITSVGNRFQLVDSRKSSGVDGDYTLKAPLAMTHVHADLLVGENIKELIDDGKHFQIRFPSGRIPEWFHHLTRESTLRIELNPDDPDRNPDRKRMRKGFALFAVFEIKEHENFENGISPEFRIDEQRLIVDLKDFMVGSYAVCFYLPLRWFSGKLNALSRVMETSVSTNRTDIELRMFGIHEVFEQAVEDFSNKLAQSANDHLELELNFIRHCKKLLDRENELLEGSSDIVEVMRKQCITDPNRTAWDNISSSGHKNLINETYSLLTRLFQVAYVSLCPSLIS